MKRMRDEKLEGAYFAIGRERRPRRRSAAPRRARTYWVHIPVADGWIAAQRLAVQDDGVIVVAELRVFPAERPREQAGEWSGTTANVPRGGVSTLLLRRVPIGGRLVAPVVNDWLEQMLGDAPRWPAKSRAAASRAVRDLGLRITATPAPRPGKRGRRPLYDETFYRRVAAEYKRWFSENPALHIANRWARGDRVKARNWIHTARHKYGLLPKTKKGRLPLAL